MAHIETHNPLPGISSLFVFRPETGGPMAALAQALLRGPSPLSTAERELIASVVSADNGCRFCELSHTAAACAIAGDTDFVARVKRDVDSAPISEKMKALLVVARQVAKSGKAVSEDAIAHAKAASATDVDIHDTVLIAAAFCMFNRYVDGLAAPTPQNEADYVPMGKMLAEQGYVRPR
jgi:uncharacterized peroxidase-related enzyme